MKRPISIIPLLLLTVFVLAFIIPMRGGTVSRGIRIVAKSGESLYLYKDYHALVVGVGDYTQGWPDLPGAVKDAREVASSLKELGFTVKLVLDPTSSQLKSALNNMAFRLGREKNRALLLYYAGHGETLELADGTEFGYIIPTDSPLKSRDPMGFDDKAVSMRDIEDLALKVKSKHFLMLFDSCFSGSLFSLVRAAPVDITEKSARPVRQFITAGEAGEQVPDKSVFKIVFLDGIRGDADLNDDGYVTGSELGMHLQDKVVNYTRGGQHPQYGKINNPKLDKGDFIFALKTPSQPSTQISAAPSPSLKAEKQRLAEEREQLERERQELERLKIEIDRKKLEAERKRLETEKEKLEIAKLQPKPKYSPRTIDLGLVHYTQAPKSFLVELPNNFSKVEIGVYGKGDDTPNSYGGWNAWLKVNGQTVWKFKRWDKKEGGVIADYTRGGQEVREVTGRDKYLNATSFFKPGINQITYYHYNEGPGINVNIRIY